MIHERPSLENEDPRLKDMFRKMFPAGMSCYGLGYLDQLDEIIPQSRFNNFVPSDCKKHLKPKMHKLFSIMEGCKKHTIDHRWMKNMLNWDLHTQPEAESFDLSNSYPKKIKLSHEWKAYMQKNNIWLSFYEWKKKQENIDVQMADVESLATKHSWTATDGSKIETSTTFPPVDASKIVALTSGDNHVVQTLIHLLFRLGWWL